MIWFVFVPVALVIIFIAWRLIDPREAAVANRGRALRMAAGSGNLWLINLLIALGADVNGKTDGGSTALILAAAGAKTGNVRALVAAGADANVRNVKGAAALDLATGLGDEGSVTALIAAGADVNAVNDKGSTALSLATSGEVSAVLRAAGATT